ncbi:unnamed protein product, partial [marine sediment metagenome]
AATILYSKHPELADILNIEDLTRPETRENFYGSALKYYFAVGLQKGLDNIQRYLIEKKNLPVTLDDILKRWSAKSSDRLLKKLKHERAALTDSQKRLDVEIEKREIKLSEQKQITNRLRERNNWLEKELKSYQEFADKVKATLGYRVYKSLQVLLGKKRGKI